MELVIKKTTIDVIREDGDPKLYTDSLLLYKVKQKLNSMGFDFIKKRMWKDGHMVDDDQQYLRDRKHKGHPKMVYWNRHAVYGAWDDYNKGYVTLIFDQTVA